MKQNKTRFLWITLIKKTNIWAIILCIAIIIEVINFVFSSVYYNLNVLGCDNTFFDYFYFSNISSFTIGYGDTFPKTELGKILVIIHSFISYVIFAILVAVLTAKLFYPKDTIKFSKKMFINKEKDIIGFRILNTHKEALINPDIRVFYSEHRVGNVIANTEHIGSFNLSFLGTHDYSCSVEVSSLFVINLEKATCFDNNNEKKESRFRLIVSISGNNGIQEIAQIKRYYATDFVEGKGFKPIEYNKEDQKKWRSINYYKFGDFENDFESIIGSE